MSLFKRDLRLVWDREHRIASLFLSGEAAGRCVDAREWGDELVLHFDAEGRCVEAEFLDPDASLPQDASAETALRVAFEMLATHAGGDEAG